MDFADENVPKWVKEVQRQYGNKNTKYACVGYVDRSEPHYLTNIL